MLVALLLSIICLYTNKGFVAASDLQALVDKLAVEDLFQRYCTAVDRKDWVAYRGVFTHDAKIDYTAAGGRRGTREEMALWLESVFFFFDGVQHSVSNFDIEFKSDTGRARVMFDNPFSIRWLPWPRPFFRVGGWYIALLRREDSDWKIHRLEEEIAYNTVIPSALGALIVVAIFGYITLRWLLMFSRPLLLNKTHEH